MIKYGNKGITLIELSIALAIASFSMTAIVSVHQSMSESYRQQQLITGMQQNLRAAMEMMEREIRMAGYDPLGTGKFGIEKPFGAGFYGLSGKPLKLGTPKSKGYLHSGLQFTSDLDEDGSLDSNETITYCVYDYPVSKPDTRLDLARNNGGGRQLLASFVDGLGFAYAFDNNGDGELDTSNGHILWAIDSDNDGQLDAKLDSNSDGVINRNDDQNNDGFIDLGDAGSKLQILVSLKKIKAVKIWIFASTRNEDLYFRDKKTYIVGNRLISPNNRYRHRLLESTVQLRNIIM